jgi:hypothetical protein
MAGYNPAMTTTPSIDTGKVASRRQLHFQTLDQMVADAESLAAAEKSGGLQKLGNWSLGQALGHLASWINYPFDGYPFKAPWIVKLVMRPMKGRFLKGPMSSGRKIPGIPTGTVGADSISADEGIVRIRAAAKRLAANVPPLPNLLFGNLSHDEWIAINLRHAELHLSFFRAN